MTNQKQPIPISPARPLPAERLPQRLELELPDGYRTAVYAHALAEADRLPVLYVHGIQSHPGWFMGSAAALASRGHAVFQVTRRGSGENETDRGHADSAGQLLDDVGAACGFVLGRTGCRRLHLLGVSWGGKLLAAYAASARDQQAVASLTMVAPGIAPRVDLPAARKLSVCLSAMVAPRRRFGIPLNDPQLFTDNEAMREYLRKDRFALHRATARLLLASHRLDVVLRRASRGAVGVPTSLLLAEKDRIIDNAATRQVVERLTAGRCVARELPGCHVLEFEPDPHGLYAALADAMADAEMQ
ncbi:MAG TPA: alpha/beta fold hydrolase [Phycisphaerae bacterium]|nr:alpha/beta fold hydrolase [Phycisphaerae bacterium]HUT61789.1 alpha/beta fold hydrolase [Phycisphaerae bacterium]